MMLGYFSKVLWVVPLEWLRWLLVMLGMALSGEQYMYHMNNFVINNFSFHVFFNI